MCLILIRDLTELLFKFLQEQPFDLKSHSDTIFNCSGCTGLIKFCLVGTDAPEETFQSNQAGAGAAPHVAAAVLESLDKLSDCPLLQAIPVEQRELLYNHFRQITLEEDAVLIRQGENNLNLYIIVDGELAIETGGVHLATLGHGEICGEMSYLGADTAVSTVSATKQTQLLAIAGNIFGRLLADNQAVQSYMARMLAARLRKTNEARARDFASCMSGRIDEIVPAELFQIFHMHQKTGVLSLELPNGKAKVVFREGCIINAAYHALANEEAIFKILAEKKGLYRFTSGLSPNEMRAAEIGDFMMLLMEGVKRVDEEQERSG
jgi:CRP-like cAMP-binding protein